MWRRRLSQDGEAGVGEAQQAAAGVGGVGFAVGYKNIAYSEGFDDSTEAKVTLSEGPDGPIAEVAHWARYGRDFEYLVDTGLHDGGRGPGAPVEPVESAGWDCRPQFASAWHNCF